MELKKLRGLNDFNIFTTLLSAYDEARVHSKFIHALLDIKGEHYQKELFLELFIKSCGLEDFGLDVKNTVATKEDDYIDLYLTDGKKHIIIENKIYASDQEHQIKNYIEKVVNKNSEITGDDICVIYLTLEKERNMPHNNSLENFALKDGFLKYQNGGKLAELGAIRYESMHYNKEIMDWLNACLYEVSNLTNLQVLITQYKNTIELLYGNYKGVEMELEELVEENFEISKKISEEYENLKNKIKKDFINSLSKKLEERYKIYKDEDKLFINIYKDEWTKGDCYLYYCFELWDKKYPHISILPIKKKISIEKLKDKISDKDREKIKNIKNKSVLDWSWVSSYQSGEFETYFVGNDEKEKITENIYNEVVSFVDSNIDLVSKINKNIEDYM